MKTPSSLIENNIQYFNTTNWNKKGEYGKDSISYKEG
jgi:hypothetical protein